MIARFFRRLFRRRRRPPAVLTNFRTMTFDVPPVVRAARRVS